MSNMISNKMDYGTDDDGTEVSSELENEAVPELQLMNSLPKRLSKFVKHTVNTLILTTDGLDDIGFMIAPEIITQKTIYLFGIFRRLFFLILFLYFFVENFRHNFITLKFMVLYPEAGNCENLAKPWTIPQINADRNGFWEGQMDFQENSAMYTFSLFQFAVTDQNYKNWVRRIRSALQTVGMKAQNQDLALNLLYWSSWVHVEAVEFDGESAEQSLTMTGDPRHIMLNDYTQSSISSVMHDCPLSYSSTYFNFPSGTLQMSIDVPTLSRATQCNTIINPTALGYDNTVDGNNLNLKVDVYTLFSSLTVANLLNGPNTLRNYLTIDLFVEFNYFGVDYQVYRKFDSLYPSMQPMYCLGPKGANATEWNCLLKMGNSYGIPFFAHSGPNKLYPQRCDCSTTVGSQLACSQFNLLSGVIVHDWTNNQSSVKDFPLSMQPFIPALEFFYVPPVQSAATANQLAFYPAWALLLGQDNPQFQDPEWRREAYEFSFTRSFGYGSLIAFQSFSARDSSVSEGKYQLKNGACSDSFLAPNFSNFYVNSWGPLEESYYSCTQLFNWALFNSVGISSGIARLVVPTIAMSFFFGYMALVAYWKTEEYIKQIRQSHFAHQEKVACEEHAVNEFDEGLRVDISNKEEKSTLMGDDGGQPLEPSCKSMQDNGLDQMSFVDFQRRRRAELMTDDNIHGLSQPDLTAIILLEWRRLGRIHSI